MTALRRKSVFGLAVLLAAATAVADTVVTAEEVISCSVVSADTNFVRLKLPSGGVRMLYTRDIYEMRLSDANRVAEMAAQPLGVRITLDSGQPIPPPDVRAEQLRQEHAREADPSGFPGYADVVDTVPIKTSREELAARCREMDAVLRECGRDDDTVAGLLREVNREAAALGRIRSEAGKLCVYAPCGGLLGGATGGIIGSSLVPVESDSFPQMLFSVLGCGFAGLVGTAVGVVTGTVVGLIIGAATSRDPVAVHRIRVNDLVRRVNRAVAASTRLEPRNE